VERATEATLDRPPASRTARLDLHSAGPDETRAIAAALASVAEAGDVLCLWGELGAGKTVFAKGFGAGLGVGETISSPSFVLMGEYAGRLPLFHIDLYRLETAAEAFDGGLLDDRQAAGVVVIEWPDRLGEDVPAQRLDVHIEGAADEPRLLRLEAHGASHRRYVDAASGNGAAMERAP
jgi:tRNA threonylcarbamoyladenosine biosynthesis protein TsaE